jgi:hypothetical protein
MAQIYGTKLWPWRWRSAQGLIGSLSRFTIRNHDKFRHFMFSQMGGAIFSCFSKGDLQVVASF